MSDKVMLVDDDPSIRFTVQTVLEGAGFDIITVEGGEQCLAKLEGGFRGLILMDIMMPEMDGWDTIKAILAAGYMKGNIICMLTAKLDPGRKMEGLQEHVLDYVTKPFDPDDLIASTREFLSYLN